MNEHEPGSFDDLLAAAADPAASRSDFNAALGALAHHPATEPPDFWIAAAAANQAPWHRRGALFAFFRRHVAGMSLHDLVAVPGIARFLTPDRLHDRTAASKLPFDRRRGASVVMYRPETSASDDAAVYMQFSHPITTAQLAAAVAAGQARSGNTIVEVSIVE